MASFDLAIRQGDTTPTLTATILDQAGVAMNLTGASVKLIMRALSAAAPQVNAAATITDAVNGKVSYSWVAADTANSGQFQGLFRVTLSGGGTYTWPNDGYLDIWIEEDLTTDTGQLLVSVGDAKDWMGIPGTDRSQDQKLQRMIRAVRPIVEEITGPIIQRQFNETYPGGHSEIVLRHRPVLTLIAVSEFRGPAEYPLSIVQDPAHGSIYSVMLDPEIGRIVRRAPGGSIMNFFAGEQAVRAVYVAGQASVPENVRLGTLELLRVNFQQTQLGGAPTFNPSGVGGTTDDLPIGPPTGFFMPNRVREMLGANKRAPSIA